MMPQARKISFERNSDYTTNDAVSITLDCLHPDRPFRLSVDSSQLGRYLIWHTTPTTSQIEWLHTYPTYAPGRLAPGSLPRPDCRRHLPCDQSIPPPNLKFTSPGRPHKHKSHNIDHRRRRQAQRLGRQYAGLQLGPCEVALECPILGSRVIAIPGCAGEGERRVAEYHERDGGAGA